MVLLLGASCAGNETVKQYEAWAEQACKCKDAACRAAARAQGVELTQRTQLASGNAAAARAVKASGERAARCLNVADGVTP
jgi:hypothetical protein